MKIGFAMGVAALVFAAGSAQAAVTNANVTAVDIGSLTLEDGVWNGGYGPGSQAPTSQEWGWVDNANNPNPNRVWLNENWTSGGSVTLGVNVEVAESTNQYIGLNKRTRNNSGFVWTGFDIVISTPVGNVDVFSFSGSPSSPQFSNVTILNNNSPSVTLKFTGGSVGLSQFATFIMDFEIPSGPSWTYTMTQTPIPTPGALALLGLGGLAAGRRRR